MTQAKSSMVVVGEQGTLFMSVRPVTVYAGGGKPVVIPRGVGGSAYPIAVHDSGGPAYYYL